MTLKLNYSEIGLYDWQSSLLFELLGTLKTILENSGELLYRARSYP